MSTNDSRKALSAALVQWGKRQRALDRNRDPLVLASLEAGISKEEIHMSMGIARTTIDRIQSAAKRETP